MRLMATKLFLCFLRGNLVAPSTRTRGSAVVRICLAFMLIVTEGNDQEKEKSLSFSLAFRNFKNDVPIIRRGIIPNKQKTHWLLLPANSGAQEKKKETNAMQFIMYVDINPKWSVFRRNEWKTKHECLNVKTLQFASRRPAGRSNSLPAFSSALCARLNRETKATLLLCMNGHPPSTTHNGRKAFHAALTSI